MMFHPFNRRDSAGRAFGSALPVAMATGVIAAEAGWGEAGAVLAALASGSVVLLLFGVLTRRLPPDLRLRPSSAIERRVAAEPPPVELARLRVALCREPLAFYRLDVFLDGVRVGQLRPGTVFVMRMLRGRRVLSARVWLRRLDLRDEINALPGTDSDFVIRGSGGKARNYAVDRHGLPALLRDPRMVLVEPLRPFA